MKNRLTTCRFVPSIGAALALGAIGGCTGTHTASSPPSSTAGTTGAGHTAHAPRTASSSMHRAHGSTPGDASPVTFATPAGREEAPHTPATGAVRTTTIGLFGEIGMDEEASNTPSDGGSNLAQVSFATEGACFDPEVSRTGEWMVFASTMHRRTADIYLKSVTGKTQTQITSDPADDVMPTFSPASKSIAFASNRSGNWDIFTTTLDGGGTVQITSDPDNELHPSYSPDGTRLAYCKFGMQSGRWEIWMIDVANPSVRRFLDYGMFPQWCPDPSTSKILFQRARQRGSRYHSVWTIDVVNGEAMHPTEIVSASNAATINPTWSPDGSRIAFVTVVDPQQSMGEKPSQSDVWIVNSDGTGRVALTNGRFANYQPSWSSDGSVFFISDRSGTDNIWSVSSGRATRMSPAPAATTNVATAEGTNDHASDHDGH